MAEEGQGVTLSEAGGNDVSIQPSLCSDAVNGSSTSGKRPRKKKARKEDPQPPPRIRKLQSENLADLGKSLAEAYGHDVRRGLARSMSFYMVKEPVTCSETKLKELCLFARKAAERCCPAASEFFRGFEAAFGDDVYKCLLDFELYTFELQRQDRVHARVRARLGKASSSECPESDASSSSSSLLLEPGQDSDIQSSRCDPASDCAESKIAPSGHCTGFAWVSESSCLVAQTAELPPSLYGHGDFDCILHLRSSTGTVVAYDTDGRLCPIGLNSAGNLGVTVFNLFQSQPSGFEQESITVQLLLWELLLRCHGDHLREHSTPLLQHTLQSALSWLQALPVGFMCGGQLAKPRCWSVMKKRSKGPRC
eukprot:5735894-Amphidinium_carterae.1